MWAVERCLHNFIVMLPSCKLPLLCFSFSSTTCFSGAIWFIFCLLIFFYWFLPDPFQHTRFPYWLDLCQGMVRLADDLCISQLPKQSSFQAGSAWDSCCLPCQQFCKSYYSDNALLLPLPTPLHTHLAKVYLVTNLHSTGDNPCTFINCPRGWHLTFMARGSARVETSGLGTAL